MRKIKDFLRGVVNPWQIHLVKGLKSACSNDSATIIEQWVVAMQTYSICTTCHIVACTYWWFFMMVTLQIAAEKLNRVTGCSVAFYSHDNTWSKSWTRVRLVDWMSTWNLKWPEEIKKIFRFYFLLCKKAWEFERTRFNQSLLATPFFSIYRE